MIEIISTNCTSLYQIAQYNHISNIASVHAAQVLPQLITEIGTVAGLVFCANKGMFLTCPLALMGSRFVASTVSDQTRTLARSMGMKPTCSTLFSDTLYFQVSQLNYKYFNARNKTEFIFNFKAQHQKLFENLSLEDRENVNQLVSKLMDPEIKKSGYSSSVSQGISHIINMPETAVNWLTSQQALFSIGKVSIEKASKIGLAVLGMIGMYRAAEVPAKRGIDKM